MAETVDASDRGPSSSAWTPERSVDETLVRALVAEVAPALATREVSFLAAGWENSVWVVDGRWAFRFPLRETARPGVEREIAVLPGLGPMLPAAVPVPELVGRPRADYPWPYFGAKLVRGREATDAPLDDETRADLAEPLARFLSALHSHEVFSAFVPTGLVEADPLRRAEMGYRAGVAEQRLDELAGRSIWRAPAALRQAVAEARELPDPRRTVVVHGDLHFRHLIVDGDRRLTGVIDWSDLCHADASVDLQLVWAFLPPAGRARFLRVYPATEEQLGRARVQAVFLWGSLALYALDRHLAGVFDEAVSGLQRLADDALA